MKKVFLTTNFVASIFFIIALVGCGGSKTATTATGFHQGKLEAGTVVKGSLKDCMWMQFDSAEFSLDCTQSATTHGWAGSVSPGVVVCPKKTPVLYGFEGSIESMSVGGFGYTNGVIPLLIPDSLMYLVDASNLGVGRFQYSAKLTQVFLGSRVDWLGEQFSFFIVNKIWENPSVSDGDAGPYAPPVIEKPKTSLSGNKVDETQWIGEKNK